VNVFVESTIERDFDGPVIGIESPGWHRQQVIARDFSCPGLNGFANLVQARWLLPMLDDV
jgi:hypothetical protein